MEFAERRAAGNFTKEELESLRQEYAYSPEGLDDSELPPLRIVAYSAIGEPAFTDDAVTAAVHAAGTAADAFGMEAGEKVDPAVFDDFYDPAYAAERRVQMELFRRMFPQVRTDPPTQSTAG